MMKFKIELVFILSLFLFSCGTNQTVENESRVEELPYYNEANFTPKWFTENADELANFHQIPPFQFTNQNGEAITEETVKNKIYVTDFFLATCSGICPKMMTNMHLLQDEFIDNENVLLLSHSVTPEKDSVEALNAYANRNNIQAAKWHLLTGNRSEIYDLGRNAYFIEEDLGVAKDENDFLHTENFVLIDQNRHIRGIYNGLNKSAVQQLIADIYTLLSN